MAALWLAKMLGTMGAIGAFFVLYFWTMAQTAPRAVTVPQVFADGWVDLQPWAVFPYGSLWLYVSLAPAFAANVAALRAYAGGAAAIVALAMACYWLFPTVAPVFAVDGTPHPLLQFLKSADAGGNALPSLHVAFAFYTALVLGSQLRSLGAPRWMRWLNAGWCVAIVHSTLATHQHGVLDVLAGLATTGLALALVWSRPGRHLWRGRGAAGARRRVAPPGALLAIARPLAAEWPARPLRKISRR